MLYYIIAIKTSEAAKSFSCQCPSPIQQSQSNNERIHSQYDILTQKMQKLYKDFDFNSIGLQCQKINFDRGAICNQNLQHTAVLALLPNKKTGTFLQVRNPSL